MLHKVSALLESEPSLCTSVLTNIHDMLSDLVIAHDEFGQLCERLLYFPEILIKCCHLWGAVLRFATTAQRSKLLLTINQDVDYWIPVVSSFPLKLPEESRMLAVVCDLFGTYAMHSRPIAQAREMVHGFVTSDADLENIVQETNTSVVVRARAALLLLLLSGDLDKFTQHHKQIVISAIAASPRLTRILVWILAMLNALHRREFQTIASEALERSRGTDVWYSLESFFELWREVSHAPIAASSNLDEYLAWS
jgi:hypothetical protein